MERKVIDVISSIAGVTIIVVTCIMIREVNNLLAVEFFRDEIGLPSDRSLLRMFFAFIFGMCVRFRHEFWEDFLRVKCKMQMNFIMRFYCRGPFYTHSGFHFWVYIWVCIVGVYIFYVFLCLAYLAFAEFY